MNNHRLLKGLLAAILSGVAVCSEAQKIFTLEEIFSIAEENSIQLKPSFTNQDIAEQEVRIARSKRLPDINANLQLSFLGDGFITKRNFTGYEKAPIPHLGTGLGLNVEQPIYTGGAITGGIEMAELKTLASRFSTDLKRDNIRFELAGYYLEIYKYKNLRKVVENNLTAARKVLSEMEARFQQGTALQNDITRYELLISNLELQLIRIDNTLAIFNNNLVTITGLPEGTVIEPDTTILLRSLPKDSESHWQETAMENSPGLQLAKNQVEFSRTGEKLAKSEMLPKIGLQAGWTIDGPILVEVPPINRNLSYWWVGLGVSYNISSLYKDNKSVKKSKIDTHHAIEELEAAKENVNMAVRADYIKYLEAYEELKTQEKSVELAERNYKITSTRYSADVALITDMLDAANSLLDAQQQLVNSRINIIYSYYKLLFTTGTI